MLFALHISHSLVLCGWCFGILEYCPVASHWFFPSAFNLIQPNVIADWLIGAHSIDYGLACKLIDIFFLMDWTEKVRVNGVLSYDLLSSTSSPKRCILSSLSLVLYTYVAQGCYDGRHMNKSVNWPWLWPLLWTTIDIMTWGNDRSLTVKSQKQSIWSLYSIGILLFCIYVQTV